MRVERRSRDYQGERRSKRVGWEATGKLSIERLKNKTGRERKG